MVIFGSHIHKFSVSKDMKKNDKRRDMLVEKVVAHLCLTLIIWLKFNNDKRRRDMVVGKVVAHLCLTLIIILRFSVEHDRVVQH
jgi:hypothetical protein